MLKTSVPSIDLGKVKYGKATHFNFTIKNEGPVYSIIEKLVVGCGSCTKASSVKSILQPGEESIINITFTPGSTGKQTKHVTVRYDENQVLKLEFTAEVYA